MGNVRFCNAEKSIYVDMYKYLLRVIDSFSVLLLAFFLSGCLPKPVSISSNLQPHTADAGYQKLERLLQQKDWQAADRETFLQLLVRADRKDAGWLGVKDVESISCNDWATINRLWQTYSKRRFGFRIQTRIWESVGGKVGQYDHGIALKVGDMVGWRTAEEWQHYNDLNFSLQANPGHLPATTGNGVSGGIWGGIATISGRVKACAATFNDLPESLQSAAELEMQHNRRTIQSEQSCIGCYLVGADLQGMDLTFKDLAHADLRNANLEGAILGAANLKLADLRGANLKGVVLSQANLWGASFDGANLSDSDFSCGGGSCTSMQGASFKNASLVRANLDCLDCTVVENRGLVNVNLAGANLTDALVKGTSFEDVNLCDAILPNGKPSQQKC